MREILLVFFFVDIDLSRGTGQERVGSFAMTAPGHVLNLGTLAMLTRL
ncbi:MAG TPA: hypothetical protein VMM76_26310 [Pirellulaceae bacterium]|nr:hypothetical protein [Pirellulaceae bacterium]